MALHRMLMLSRRRIAISTPNLHRVRQLGPPQWVSRWSYNMQQRYQSDNGSNPRDRTSDSATFDKTKAGTEPNTIVSPVMRRDSEDSTIEVLKTHFRDWEKKQLSKHGQQMVDEILAPGPPRSNAFRNSQYPVTFDSSSILNTSFDKPGSGVGRFNNADNPFTASRVIETPLAKWQNEIAQMDSSLHIGIKTGRQMEVMQTRPGDLGAKINVLGALISRNNIRTEERMQKFHERPGLKRKRLRRQRWRKRFAGSFASICRRATSLASQGW